MQAPPPYPGPTRQLYTPGYRQSYSGSEASTDNSVSSTDLSTLARQEPQGEEQSHVVSTPLDPGDNSEYSILSRLGLPVTPNPALEVKSTNSSTFYVTGSMQPHYSVSNNQDTAYSEVGGAGTHMGILHPQVCSTTSALFPYATVSSNVYSTSPVMNQIHLPSVPQQYFSGTQGSQVVPQGSQVVPQGSQVVPQGSQVVPQGSQVVPQGSYHHHPSTTRYEIASTQRYSATQRKQLTLGLQGLALASAGQAVPQGQVQGQPQSQIYNKQYQKVLQQNQASQRQTQTQRIGVRQSQEVPLRQKSKTQLPARPKSAEPRYPLTLESHNFTTAQDLPTPPEYPGVPIVTQVKAKDSNKELRHSCEMLDRLTQTYSQPDLTRLAELQLYAQAPTGRGDAQQCQQPASAGRVEVQQIQQPSPRHQQMQVQQQLVKQQQAKQASPTQSPQKKAELDHAAVATRATQMVERLSEENRSLRKELEGYYNKTCKLQKLEQEIKKLTDAYENLVKHSQKREALDRVMRLKLEAERKKLHDTNKELQDQLDRSLTQLSQKEIYNMDDSELKKEVQRKDSMISKLISHNREISSAKEQLEHEVASQRNTLQEQKAHIEILDNALGTAQSSVAKFEEETLRRTLQEQRLQDMQEALSQLQLATEQREAIGHKLRSKLEEEIRLLKNQQAQANKTSDTDEGISSDSESPTSIQSLVQQMQEKEQRVVELESDILKWEQRFLEETAMRQLAVDAASTPKDARIAALEQGSAETEKILAEARTERLKHLEEVYQANRKAAQLEAKVRTLQAQIAEKDAMIKVLQRHSSLSRTSSVSSLFGSPVHSPRPSIVSPFSMISPLSLSGSVPPSGVNSRQNSQLAQVPIHSKSNSTGSPAVPPATNTAGAMATTSSSHSNQEYKVIRDLQQKLAAQAALLAVDSNSEEVKSSLWQV